MARGKRQFVNGLCKLFWVVDGNVKEEIFKDNPVPYHVACWKANQLESTTHRIGQVDVVSVTTKPYHQFKLFKPS